MASGLQWEEAYELGSTITEMLYLAPDMGAFAADQPLRRQPGTFQQYSSGTTNILCGVLQDLVVVRMGFTPEIDSRDRASATCSPT